MAEVILNKDNFDAEVIKSDKPVLVDFWAEWCGPCRMLSPVIAEIANEQDGKVKVCKLNIDEEPALAEKYGVEYIPTLIVFKKGEPADSSVGFVPKEKIESMLKGSTT